MPRFTKGLQLICAIFVTAFMGNNIARANHGTTSIVNYSLFVGVWWLFTLLYFLPTSFIEKFSIPVVDLAMDGFSVLFGFCAAVALPAYLHVHSCSNYVRYCSMSLLSLGQDLISCRHTQAQTRSPTARMVSSRTANKLRLHAPSCGLDGSHSSHRSPSPS